MLLLLLLLLLLVVVVVVVVVVVAVVVLLFVVVMLLLVVLLFVLLLLVVTYCLWLLLLTVDICNCCVNAIIKNERHSNRLFCPALLSERRPSTTFERGTVPSMAPQLRKYPSF